MPRTYDPSPLASQICGGHYCQKQKTGNIRPHGTPDWTLIYTLHGAGLFESQEKTAPPLVSRPGLLILIPPGCPSRTTPSGGRFDHLWLHFLARSHWLEMMGWPSHPIGMRQRFAPAGPIRQKIVSLFRKVIAFTMAAESDREEFALHSLEELLLWCGRLKDTEAAHHIDRPTEICLSYIAENPSKPITLELLARLSGQSVSRLTQMFRRQTGLSPIQYMEQTRLELAMRLLTRTGMHITVIAEKVGFNNPFYFSRRFRIHTGYSPREFRNKTNLPPTILRRPDLLLNPDDTSLLKNPPPKKS